MSLFVAPQIENSTRTGAVMGAGKEAIAKPQETTRRKFGQERSLNVKNDGKKAAGKAALSDSTNTPQVHANKQPTQKKVALQEEKSKVSTTCDLGLCPLTRILCSWPPLSPI
jgi:hypothetical protein